MLGTLEGNPRNIGKLAEFPELRSQRKNETDLTSQAGQWLNLSLQKRCLIYVIPLPALVGVAS